jgi:hypothetical protein
MVLMSLQHATTQGSAQCACSKLHAAAVTPARLCTCPAMKSTACMPSTKLTCNPVVTQPRLRCPSRLGDLYDLGAAGNLSGPWPVAHPQLSALGAKATCAGYHVSLSCALGRKQAPTQHRPLSPDSCW